MPDCYKNYCHKLKINWTVQLKLTVWNGISNNSPWTIYYYINLYLPKCFGNKQTETDKQTDKIQNRYRERNNKYICITIDYITAIPFMLSDTIIGYRNSAATKAKSKITSASLSSGSAAGSRNAAVSTASRSVDERVCGTPGDGMVDTTNDWVTDRALLWLCHQTRFLCPMPHGSRLWDAVDDRQSTIACYLCRRRRCRYQARLSERYTAAAAAVKRTSNLLGVSAAQAWRVAACRAILQGACSLAHHQQPVLPSRLSAISRRKRSPVTNAAAPATFCDYWRALKIATTTAATVAGW